MKKKDILNLIKCHTEGNNAGFRSQAYEIAKEFDETGDPQLAQYIMSMLSDAGTFSPQSVEEIHSPYISKLPQTNEPLLIPETIKSDIVGIINAVSHDSGVNKFLFEGAPGTGKTETARQVARILERELYIVNFDSLIDSKLGETSKNISSLFEELNSFPAPEHIVILFDEIDALALDRNNSNDLREMGRATSSMLKGMDYLNNQLVMIATTNMYSHFDKALVRRFDFVVDFNRYTQDDLLDISNILINNLLNQFGISKRNKNLFEKILKQSKRLPYPGELKNILRTAVAFSEPDDSNDYLRRLYKDVHPEGIPDLKELKEQGFTMREIEVLTGVSKSQASRALSE